MYTLIIAEKPNAAKRISHALSDKIKEHKESNVSYFEFDKNNKKVIVAAAVGHLFTLKDKGAGWKYPVFDVEWMPSYNLPQSKFTRKYYNVLKKLAKGADTFVNGCDLDREGELIFRNILRFICGKKDAKRMKFSTLTKSDLVEAYNNMSEHINFSLAEAGEARHLLDYFWGISISRALTIALREAGGFKVLSTGRVQGPTLNILAEKEDEISKFKSEPFWELKLITKIQKQEIEAFHIEGKFTDKKKVEEIFNKCKGKNGIIKDIENKEYKQKPPIPFDLTTMQREAYAQFRFSPKKTLDIAQKLYEQALISYPRTSSQKLPAKIGYKKIIEDLKKNKNFTHLCEKLPKPLKPNEGKKSDPAHPSIFPTGQLSKKLSIDETKLYDLIVKRFLAVFGKPAIRESAKLVIDVEGEDFIANGVRTVKANWIELYHPYAKFKDQILPEVKKGPINIKDLELLEKETQPPKRYTQASILKKLDDLGLGTKATRADILQTLYDRGYIKEQAIIVTDLGKAIIEALRKYSPQIIDTEMTIKFEENIEKIAENKIEKEKVIEEAKKNLTKILNNFKKNEAKIGKKLLEGVISSVREESFIGKCKCKGNLEIKISRNQKKFVGCSSYPKCTETFPLPQKGRISILKDTCEKCGLNILSIKQFKKRIWKLCIRDGFVNFKNKEPIDETQKSA